MWPKEEILLPYLAATLVTLGAYKSTIGAWVIGVGTPCLPQLFFSGGPSAASSPFLLASLAYRVSILVDILAKKE